LAAVTQEQREGLLGVESSLRGRRWELRGGDDRLAVALSQRLGLPEIVGRVLAGRGVGLEEAERFLNPTLRDLLPDPATLKDTQKAAERIARALESGEKVAVFGDYDVDGATSSALLLRYFRALGVDIIPYIPDRMSEGYGPNAPALRSLRQRGASLAITVDCGITSFEALEAAAEVGLEIIVVDHHKAEPALPKAVAVVNPNRLDDESGQGQLAAVGVTFLLLVALNRHLRNQGYFTAERAEPDLRAWLDLVALGTVCDVVPLTGVNGGFVTQGLKVLAQRRNSGLLALGDVARVDDRPGTYHLGFLLGPRVNAGGRVGQADLGVRLLSTEDPGEARALAEQLDSYNSERREIEAAVLDEAIAQVEAGPAPEGLVFAAAQGWHPGVIGIVASRLKDRYDLPALVIALDEEGLGKGSGRSVRGVDLGASVIAARQAGLLVNGGGHAMAAGLTLSADKLEELRTFLASRLSRQLADIAYQPAMGFDGLLQPGAATSELLAVLEQVGPFGTANPEPRFVLPGVKAVQAQVVGESHVRCRLVGADGSGLKAIAFKALDSALGEKLLAGGGRAFHVAGKLRADNWAGRDAVQFLIDDAAEA
jgi:single-stranded-DNA-specific exonuclease